MNGLRVVLRHQDAAAIFAHVGDGAWQASVGDVGMQRSGADRLHQVRGPVAPSMASVGRQAAASMGRSSTVLKEPMEG